MVFGAIDILSESALIVVPTMIVLRIQMAVARKVVVIGCFFTRLLYVSRDIAVNVCGWLLMYIHHRNISAITVELVYRQRNRGSADPMLAIWEAAVCAQVVQCLGIIVACVPHLKPFMDGLQSTGLRMYYLPGETSRRGEYGYSSKGGTTGHELSGLPGVVNSTTVFADQRQTDWDDTLSQNSQSHIIRETRTWVVEEQYHPDAAAGRTTDTDSSGSHGVHELTSH